MSAGMEISGLSSLDAKIKAIALKKERAQNKALRDGAEILAESMRSHVNRSLKDHKHLQDDIQISNVKQDIQGNKYIEVGPGKNTKWRAGFLEYGTSRAPAYPFIGPAVAENGEKVIGNMKDAVKGP